MREGWKEISINGEKIRTCGKCLWYKHRLVKSGNNPIYANMCAHPDVTQLSAAQPSSLYKGNLSLNIHGYAEPGKWCPYSDKIERELKIDKILNNQRDSK